MYRNTKSLLAVDPRRFSGYRYSQKNGQQSGASMGYAAACEVLGLPCDPGLTLSDVKQAKTKFALQYHPDKTGGTITNKWHDMLQALDILMATIGGKTQEADSQKPSVTANRASRDEWTNATSSMYRVPRWRVSGKLNTRHSLGTAVQSGMLEDLV